MPILDLKADHGVPRLRLLGDIRLGKPKPKKGPGQALPCFALRDAPELHKEYGYPARPTSLNIVFPFNDPDMNLDDWHRWYGSGGLKCRGNGETIDLLYGPEGTMLIRNGVCQETFAEGDEKFQPGDTVPCGGYREIYPKCKECEGVAYIKVMIQEVYLDGILGYYRIATRSKHGILNLRGAMTHAMSIAQRVDGHPYLAGIPFILSLVPEMKSAPMKDKDGKHYRAKVQKFILHLDPHPEWVKLKMQAMVAQSLSTPSLALSDSTRAPESQAARPGPQFSPSPTQEAPYTKPEEPPPGWEEFEEGEFEEIEEEPPQEPTEDPNYDLAGLSLAFKTQIQDTAGDKLSRGRTGNPSSAQLGLLNGLLKDIVGEEQRKLVLAWIFDQPTLDFSTKSLSKAQVEAILDGLDPEKDDAGKYAPTNEKAIEAVKVMLRQARVDSGQIEMEV